MKTFSLGRPFGVEVRIHGTTLVLLAVVGLLALVSGGLWGVVDTTLLAGVVLASITLHELGHIGAARLFGIGTTGVTLYPFGGLARLTREARSAREEWAIALAGPAVNVALIGLAAVPVLLLGPIEPFWTIVAVNAVLAVFNLIPAFPMDGGRVLRGALWNRLGYVEATRLAARAGQGFAVLFGIVGLLYSPMLLVIALFVFLQATAELGRLQLARLAGYNPNPAQPQPMRGAAPGGFGGFRSPGAWQASARGHAAPANPVIKTVRVVRVSPDPSRPTANWRTSDSRW